MFSAGLEPRRVKHDSSGRLHSAEKTNKSHQEGYLFCKVRSGNRNKTHWLADLTPVGEDVLSVSLYLSSKGVSVSSCKCTSHKLYFSLAKSEVYFSGNYSYHLLFCALLATDQQITPQVARDDRVTVCETADAPRVLKLTRGSIWVVKKREKGSDRQKNNMQTLPDRNSYTPTATYRLILPSNRCSCIIRCWYCYIPAVSVIKFAQCLYLMIEESWVSFA